ncbi:DUF2165 family protein [Ruegeria marisrubri]|nr:DUF2165 family protein [Ruegeria marisrubri]
MLDTVLIAVGGFNLAFMAAWLTIGALENVFHPFLNETYTAQVMDLERMREEYPEAYTHVSYRRVTNAKLRKRLFAFIVVWELLATASLWLGTAAMGAAVLGLVPVSTALALGLVGTMLFNSVWAGFLIAGNFFCYWFGHEGGQNTHFQMLLWGLANCVLLIGLASYF